MAETKGKKNIDYILNHNNFPFLYLFICSMGLIELTKYLSKLIGSFLFFTDHNLVVNDYLRFFFYPGKKYELLSYVFTLIALFLYYLIAYVKLYERFAKEYRENYTGINKLYLFIITLTLNLFLLIHHVRSNGQFVLGLIVWLVVLIYLYLPKSRIDININITTVYSILLIIVVLQIVHIFSPFIFKKMYMINEFLDIPEETMIVKHADDTNGLNQYANKDIVANQRYVNNNQYIDSHNLFGIANKYDLENDLERDPFPIDTSYIYLPKNKALQMFMNDNKLNSDGKYYYNDRIHALTLLDKMFSSERIELNKIAQNDEQRRAINQLYFSSYISQQELKSKLYSDEEKAFLQSNKFEIHWQILNRWILHHHNFVLGPINEYALGKNISDIYMQYGWLNVTMMENILKLLGGVTYQAYFKTWFSFYYIYYGLLLLLIYYLLRDVKYVLLSALLLSCLLNDIGFDFLLLGPGLNPIRHFFDIFVIFYLYLYFEKDKKTYLYFAFFFAIVGILNNTWVGFFCLGATVSVVFLKLILNKQLNNYRIILPMMVTGFVGCILLFWGGVGKDGFAQYYLQGLLGFPIKVKTTIYIAITISVFLSVSLILIKSKDNLKFIALFLFFYSQMLLIYYIWGGTENHLLNFAPIYALTFVIYLKLLLHAGDTLKRYENIIIGIFIVLSIAGCGKAMHKYYTEKKAYYEIFKDHKTYEWKFDTAEFTSTMNPKYFINSVNLINKYEGQKGIYIISKYDSIIPFLSQKYSAMPYFDVSFFLITKKEIDECINTIRNEKPQYLFVDTDIDRNLNTDIISKNVPFLGYLHDESVWRVQRLNLLKDIFAAVRNDYRPVEKGYLITVYRKK